MALEVKAVPIMLFVVKPVYICFTPCCRRIMKEWIRVELLSLLYVTSSGTTWWQPAFSVSIDFNNVMVT